MGDDKYNLSNKVRNLRNYYRLSQTVFSDYLGVTRKVIGAIEEGRCLPSTELLEAIKNKFDITIHEFVLGRKFKK